MGGGVAGLTDTMIGLGGAGRFGWLGNVDLADIYCCSSCCNGVNGCLTLGRGEFLGVEAADLGVTGGDWPGGGGGGGVFGRDRRFGFLRLSNEISPSSSDWK